MILHTDCVINHNLGLVNKNLRSLNIKSDSTKRKITSPGISVMGGSVSIENVILQASANAENFINTFGADSALFIGKNVEFSGAVSVASIVVSNMGNVLAPNEIAGSVTGPRYNVSRAGVLLVNGRGPNAIPGNSDGYKNPNDGSVYA